MGEKMDVICLPGLYVCLFSAVEKEKALMGHYLLQHHNTVMKVYQFTCPPEVVIFISNFVYIRQKQRIALNFKFLLWTSLPQHFMRDKRLKSLSVILSPW